jgi:hypothetical protein
MKITIDKNIPRPNFGYELPFGQMEIGDSFLLPKGVSQAYARQLIAKFQKGKTARFSLLKTEDGYRCWRVA